MTILLVEDDTLYAQQVKKDLFDLGYDKVLHTSSAKEAIAMVSKEEIDLIIMDVGLIDSNLDGIGVAHEIRKKYEIPIIFLSSFSDRTTLDRIKAVPDAHYLVKPCSTRQLFVSIDMALEMSYRDEVLPKSAHEAGGCPLYSRQNHFYVKGSKNNYERVDVHHIKMIASVRGGVSIVAETGKYILTASMKSFLEQFPHSDLIRVNRSTIVHRSRISAINDKEIFLDFLDEDSPLSIGQGFWTEQKDKFIKLKSD